MARRRRKQASLSESLLGFAVLAAFYLGFQASNSLTVGAVCAGIVFGGFVAGMLYISMLKAEKLKRSGIAEIDKMDGFTFEKYLGHLFRAYGYEVLVTQPSGDFGADLVVKRNGVKTVIQAKRYSNNVGIKAVQEAKAAIAHYEASSAWVVSNRYYTEAAKELAKSNKVRLVDRDELIEMILQMKDSQSKTKKIPVPQTPLAAQAEVAAAQASPEASDELHCPRCGSLLILRKAPRGEFYGCSNFPKCRMTKPV